MAKQAPVTIEGLYALKPTAVWQQLKREHFSFWMICGYLFVEYVRPQSIIPALDFLPWAKVFLLMSLVGVFTDKSCKWVGDPANKWMIVFLLIILLSSWLAYYPADSWRLLPNFYTWVIIYFLIINIVNTRERFFIFLAIFVIASFKISLSLALVWARRGFAFTTWGLMGPPGFFQNSGELAVQMVVFFPIALAIAEHLKPHVSKLKYGILVLMPVTAAMTVLGASSRGGQVALACQMLLMYWRKIFRLKVLIGIAAVIYLALMLLPAEQKERFSKAGSDRTSEQRLLYWEHGWQMMLDHPLLGVGYFNFARYYEIHHSADMLYESAQLPHNIFIQVGTDAGFIGLSIFLILILKSFMAARHAAKFATDPLFASLGRALNFSLIGFLIAGQFVTVTYYPFFWINLALSVALKNFQRRAT
jgi:putative inorganic carbon (hco3(-)) transporter